MAISSQRGMADAALFLKHMASALSSLSTSLDFCRWIMEYRWPGFLGTFMKFCVMCLAVRWEQLLHRKPNSANKKWPQSWAKSNFGWEGPLEVFGQPCTQSRANLKVQTTQSCAGNTLPMTSQRQCRWTQIHLWDTTTDLFEAQCCAKYALLSCDSSLNPKYFKAQWTVAMWKL